jgi:capsular exopolysaccharide synthesis family protein
VKQTAEAVIIFNKTKIVQAENEGVSPFDPQTLSQMVTSRWVVRKALEEPNVAKLPSVREQLYPVEWLRRELKATYLSPELMTIALSGYNPSELGLLVDAVSRAYVQELGGTERTVRLDRVRKVEAIINKLDLFVTRERREFKEWVDANHTASPEQRQRIGEFDRKRRESLIAQKVDARNRLDRLKLLVAQDQKNGGPRVRPSQVKRALDEHREVQDLKGKIAAKQKSLPERISVMGDGKLQECRDEIKKLQDDLLDLEKKLIPGIRADLAKYNQMIGDETLEDNKFEIEATIALIGMVDEEIAHLDKAIRNEGPETLEIQERLARFSAEERVVDALRTKRAFWNAEADTPGSASVKDDAVVFAQQDLKKQIMMASGAGGAALALVLFVIAYWEFRVHRINTGEDVVQGLGWRLVGQLPTLPERSRGGLRNSDREYWQNLMTESVDAARMTLLHAADLEGLRTVMVTSAVPGEGKTSLSCHLASSLARAGRKTLLLDCDMRNPAAHRLLDLPTEPGLCEVLRKEVQLTDAIRATTTTNLWFVPAGQFDEQALQTFTLAKDGFAPLLDQLKSQFDFVVIDSSPVLPVVDALAVGRNVDAVVFSLLRDLSRIPSVYEAYQRLAALGIRILGAVVNGVDTGSYGRYSRQYARRAA